MTGTYIRKSLAGEVLERREFRLGDKVERIINKIPGVKKLPCHDKHTGRLKPESPCGKMKKRLNASEPLLPTLIKRIRGE